jgi:hypothetical protein
MPPHGLSCRLSGGVYGWTRGLTARLPELSFVDRAGLPSRAVGEYRGLGFRFVTVPELLGSDTAASARAEPGAGPGAASRVGRAE